MPRFHYTSIKHTRSMYRTYDLVRWFFPHISAYFNNIARKSPIPSKATSTKCDCIATVTQSMEFMIYFLFIQIINYGLINTNRTAKLTQKLDHLQNRPSTIQTCCSAA